VVALVERGGQARAHKVERVDAKTLGKTISENVDRRSTLMTDQFGSYFEIGSKFDGGHHTVNHGKGEYVRGDASTNEVKDSVLQVSMRHASLLLSFDLYVHGNNCQPQESCP